MKLEKISTMSTGLTYKLSNSTGLDNKLSNWTGLAYCHTTDAAY